MRSRSFVGRSGGFVRGRIACAVLAAAAGASIAQEAPVPPDAASTAVDVPLLLAGGHVLDPVDGRFVRADVLVRGGLVEGVGNAFPLPAGYVRYDASGKFVIPGLADLHVHCSASPARSPVAVPIEVTAAKFLVCGITTVQDLFSSPPSSVALRDRAIPAPRVFGSGALFTAASRDGRSAPEAEPSDGAFPVASEEDVERAFAAIDPSQAELVKVTYESGERDEPPILDRALLGSIVARAHAAGLRVAVHARSVDRTLEALDAGVDLLAHVPSDRRIPGDQLARFRTAVVVPSLAALDGRAATKAQMKLLERGESLFAIAVDPWTLAAWRASASPCEGGPDGRAACDEARRRLAIAEENVQRLHGAGVRIVAGTDAGKPNTFHGVSIHRELELLVESGLSPLDALRAATSEAGLALRRSPLGRILPGAPADLVVLSGDPLERISHTRDLAAVVSRGVLLDRDLLAADVAREPAPTIAPSEVASFDDANAAARWSIVTDRTEGGGSEAAVEILDEPHASPATGVEGAGMTAGDVFAAADGRSNRFLRFHGTLRPKGFFGFAAAVARLDPNSPAGTLFDVATYDSIAFRARGDGKTYTVALVARAVSDGDYHQAAFAAGPDWTDVTIPLAALRQTGLGGAPAAFAGTDVTALRFAARPTQNQPPGDFRLEIDDVRLVSRRVP